MKSNPVLLLGIVAVLVLFAALVLLPGKETTPSTSTALELDFDERSIVEDSEVNGSVVIPTDYEISISTDKYTYYPKDPVLIEIIVKTPEERDEALIGVFGVENKYGAYKLKRVTDLDLDVGENIIPMEASIPSCSSCSGIEVPGKFLVFGAVYDDEREMIVNASIEIEILEE